MVLSATWSTMFCFIIIYVFSSLPNPIKPINVVIKPLDMLTFRKKPVLTQHQTN
jgi:hypothetical protein